MLRQSKIRNYGFAIIQEKNYEVRGLKVMLDFDLAEMYQVETKRLKEAVRRNIERFEGDDFMFELTDMRREIETIYEAIGALSIKLP